MNVKITLREKLRLSSMGQSGMINDLVSDWLHPIAEDAYFDYTSTSNAYVVGIF